MALTKAEKVSLVFRILLAPAFIASNVLRSLPWAIARGVPLGQFINAAVIRMALGRLSASQIQALVPSTRVLYKKWIATKKVSEKKASRTATADRLNVDVEPLSPTNGSILWLGDRSKATKFVLFFHGGAFAAPMSPGHLEWCWEAYVAGGPGQDADVAVAMLEYTLTPHGRQPTQLSEAAAALAHLLKSGIDPENIIIGGDSAGGNIANQLLRHLVAPHPDIPPIPSLSPKGESRLAGAFLVSPLVSNKTSAPSFKENNHVDMLSPQLVAHHNAELLVKDAATTAEQHGMNRAFAAPLDWDTSWLSSLPDVVRSMYVTAGKQEVFRDDIVSFAGEVKKRTEGRRDLVFELDLVGTEVHDVIMLEGQAKKVGDATERMRKWAQNALVGA